MQEDSAQDLKTVSDNENIVGLWRRFGAFFLDFMAVLVVISPFMAIPTLLVEANITGNFQWAFERDFARPTDTQYILPSVISVFLVMYLYFYFYAKYNKQTLGQYVLNYKIIPIDEESMIPQYGLRVFFSYIGLCTWPVSVFLALRKNNKACWWDTTTNTKVIRVIAVNKAHQPTQNPRG